jgi:hypothetical protein
MALLPTATFLVSPAGRKHMARPSTTTPVALTLVVTVPNTPQARIPASSAMQDERSTKRYPPG